MRASGQITQRKHSLRSALHGTLVPTSTGASKQILLQPAESQQHNQPGRRSDQFDADVVIPAAVPTSGTHLCSWSVPASPSHSWELPHQNRLAFSQVNRTHRVRHLADPDHSQILIATWWSLNPPHDVQITSCLSATLTLTSASTALISSTLAAFWLREQLQQFSHVGASQVVGGGHTRATSSSASPACPRTLVAQHERTRHYPRGNGRVTGPGRFATNSAADETNRV